MPAEILDRSNPQPLPSNVPDKILDILSVKLDKLKISDNDLKALQEFRRASNYIAAGRLILLLKCSLVYVHTSWDFAIQSRTIDNLSSVIQKQIPFGC